MRLADGLALSAGIGLSETYVTRSMPLIDANAARIEFVLSAISGASAGVTFMLQLSCDDENWTDITPGSSSLTTVQLLAVTKSGLPGMNRARLKVTLTAGGAEPAAAVVVADVHEDRL